MANVTIANIGGGEDTAPANTAKIEIEVGGVSKFAQLVNIYKKIIQEASVADEASITLDTGKTGWGTAMAGDNEEIINFRFTAAGVVTIISNSANAINTDTDGNLCVYDAGAGIAIKNRLGATKNIRYIVNYS